MPQMQGELFNSPLQPQESLTVYTDGACSGNPGRGGWGCVIIDGDNVFSANGGEILTTNNRMELLAAISALSAICQNAEWKTRSICVNIDSQYVKNGITVWINNWKRNNWRTSSKQPVKNKDLWELLDELNGALSIHWNWVKGHAGVKYNELCDELARKGAENAK